MKTELDDFADELGQYFQILKGYAGLPDNACPEAYQLAQDAIVLSDRFSEIHYNLRRQEQLTKVKDAALKDLIQSREKRLKEIHIHCRMVWSRCKEEKTFGG